MSKSYHHRTLQLPSTPSITIFIDWNLICITFPSDQGQVWQIWYWIMMVHLLLKGRAIKWRVKLQLRKLWQPKVTGNIFCQGNITMLTYQIESQERYSLANFLQGLLTIDAKQRWSPEQALGHPFVKGEQFTGPYLPPPAAIEKPTTTKSPQQSSSTVNVSPPQPSSSLEQSTTAVNSKSPSKNDQKPTLPTPTSPHMIPTFSKDQHPPHKQSDTTTITMPINIVRPRPQSTTQLDRLLGKSTAPVQPSPLSKFHNNASTTSMQNNTTTTTTNTKNPSAAASNKEEKKSSTTNNTTRRVKIAPMVKMRRGSHDSFCMPDEIRRTYSSVSTVLKGEKSFYNHGNHSTPHLLSSNALGSDGGDTTDIDDDHYRTLYGANHFITNNKSSSSSSSGFRALSSRHAGEAAGGLRMMGVHDKKW